jgi:hypothetical protein
VGKKARIAIPFIKPPPGPLNASVGVSQTKRSL